MSQAKIELKTLCDVEFKSAEQDIHRSMCRQNFKHFLRFCKTEDTQRSLGVQPFPIEYPYTQRVADELQYNRQNLILKSRQMIITWQMAAKTVWKCNFNISQLYPIISRIEDVAKEIKDRAYLIWENLPDWLRADADPTAFEIRWPKLKSRIKSMPCTEDVARSFSASNVMVDEAAYLKWGRLMFGAIRPIIDKYGGLDICSTPNGEDGLFYPLWHSDNKNYNKIIVHWSEHPLRDQAWADAMIADIGIIRWMREYELSFATPAGRPVYEDWNALQVQKCFDRYNPHKPLIRGFDRGFDDPAILFAQIDDDDQLKILHSEKGDRVARKVWLSHCKAITLSLFPDHQAGYLDYGAADFDKPESDGESWRTLMQRYGINLLNKKKDDIDRRLNAVRDKMKLRSDGKFGIIVDPVHCKDLINGLAGGYCYPDKPDFQGHLKPLKNKFSHEANCVEHICDNHFDVIGQAKRQFKRREFPKRRYNPVTGRPLN